MKKYILDLKLTAVERLHERYVLIKATDKTRPLPEMLPGQFAQLQIEGSKQTFLRRPISIHNVDRKQNEVWFLVQTIGDGTRQLAKMQPGDTLNVILPLGNGFTMPTDPSSRVLLAGGGVGVAPLLYMGAVMREKGIEPTFLLGARSAGDLLQLDKFKALGRVFVTTEDGSMGEKASLPSTVFCSRRSLIRLAYAVPSP